jgi:hypothetical protein
MSTPLFYVIGYLALMIPTYVLPYFGSNSIIANGVGALVGRGMTPFWWLHAWALAMLILISFVRGKHIGKSYLFVFPVMAAAFDMVPFLNWIPLIPTVMHLLALVLGVIGAVQASTSGETHNPALKGVFISAAVMTLATIGGSLFFTLNAKNAASTTAPKTLPLMQPSKTIEPPQQKEPVKSEQTEPTPPPTPATNVVAKPSVNHTNTVAPKQVKSDHPQKSRQINLND